MQYMLPRCWAALQNIPDKTKLAYYSSGRSDACETFRKEETATASDSPTKYYVTEGRELCLARARLTNSSY